VERRSLDIEEILVYPFDERARYLLVGWQELQQPDHSFHIGFCAVVEWE
jgi:hypothetical protein